MPFRPRVLHDRRKAGAVTGSAGAFLEEWTERNVRKGAAAESAEELARRCRADAAKAGIDEEELTLAGFGNLVTWFGDALNAGGSSPLR